jgi:hypothetical protein
VRSAPSIVIGVIIARRDHGSAPKSAHSLNGTTGEQSRVSEGVPNANESRSAKSSILEGRLIMLTGGILDPTVHF